MNEGFEYRETIGSTHAGRTVLGYLGARYTHSTDGEWRARVEAGQVHVDGLPADGARVLRAGECLTWRRPPWDEPDAPLGFAVLHRDTHVLAVAKPGGLPTLPGGGFLTHTLLHLVRLRWPEATPVHRLGRGTSGLVLFALSAPARQALTTAWRERRVEKTYRALVQGVPALAELTIEAPIGPVPHPRLGRIHAASPAGKPALTHVRLLAVRESTAVVEAVIPTGRPHQIRIHLAVAGHPLLGDPVYATGGGILETPGLPGDTGYWLHAHRLALEHPVTGDPLRLECAPPPLLRT